MAFIPINSPLYFPPIAGEGATGVPAFNNVAINTIGYGVGNIFQSPVTDTITHIAFRTSTINASDLQVRVETVDATTGLNSGTLWSANTNGVRTMIATDDNQYFEVALTSAASVNKGDFVAVLVQADTASAGVLVRVAGNPSYMPFGILNGSGAWTAQINHWSNVIPKFGTAGYTYINGFFPGESVTSRTYSNASTPDVYGNKIVVPFDCKVNGIHFAADIDGNVDLKILDSDGSTVLGSISVDSEYPAGQGGATRNDFLLTSDVTLTAGQTVYVVAEPSTATSIISYEISFDSTDIKKVWCEKATLVTAKDPTGSGDFTETTTAAFTIGLIISEVSATNGIGITTGSGLVR